jgi:hypothetical protein
MLLKSSQVGYGEPLDYRFQMIPSILSTIKRGKSQVYW